jgi:transcriptional regulator with XRE-family HTH domain
MELTKKEEIERILRLLKTAMRLLGFTNREIERRLNYTPSYLTRLFSGQIELRFEHIVDIARAMGMTVDEFFRFSYPDREEKLSAAAERLEAMLEEMRPTPRPPDAPSSWGEMEFEQAVVKALEKVVAQQEQEKEALRQELLEKLELFENTLRELSAYLPETQRKRRAAAEAPRPAGRRGPKRKAPA